jgi:broad specificity phosphatase PhoE
MSATTLYLIRHGATEANLRRPYILQGRGVNQSLSETGRVQATALAEFLRTHTLHHIYCSVLTRAVETAETVAAHHGLSVNKLPELTECHVGQWEGLDWGSIRTQYPEAYELFTGNPAENPYLGGESYRDVLARVEPVFTELLRQHRGETIAVVAHNIVNRVYLARILGLDLQKAKDLRQSNCCVNVIRRDNGVTSLETMNSCFHLPVEGDK